MSPACCSAGFVDAASGSFVRSSYVTRTARWQLRTIPLQINWANRLTDYEDAGHPGV